MSELKGRHEIRVSGLGDLFMDFEKKTLYLPAAEWDNFKGHHFVKQQLSEGWVVQLEIS